MYTTTPPVRHGPSEAGAPQGARVPVTLFEVSFAAAMDGDDLAMLAGALDMSTTLRSTTLRSKGDPRENDLGFARLDHFSGLFLKRGIVEGEWVLKAMTWGHPGPQAVHGWHVTAAAAARRLDPTVKTPDRAPDTAPDLPDRHVGRASNRRLSRFRRRLVGVS
ncbi:MAG TPA: hypothetical protein VFH80_00840 [Solirubrobacteraceae bacterium]|nr:hypothetical protein [Solirubrobacteraceae bacterium]